MTDLELKAILALWKNDVDFDSTNVKYNNIFEISFKLSVDYNLVFETTKICRWLYYLKEL